MTPARQTTAGARGAPDLSRVADDAAFSGSMHEHDPRWDRLHPSAGRSSKGVVRSVARSTIVLNLTAMIDVVFLLMIYFMLTFDFSAAEEALASDVPREAETSQADPFALPDQPILVTVRSAGPTAGDVRIATDSPTVGAVGSVSDLVETLAAARGPLLAEDQRFVLSPAPDASWAHTLAVYDAIARAGFTSIRLAEPGAAAAEVGR